MGTRRVSLIVALVFLLLPLEGWAHRHVAGGSGGRSGADRSSLWGAGFGVDLPFCSKEAAGPSEEAGVGFCLSQRKNPDRNVRPYSLVLGYSQVDGEHGGEELDQKTFVGGLRFSDNDPERDWAQPYAQALVGWVREDQGGVVEWSPTSSFGLGVELGLGRLVTLHVQYDVSLMFAERMEAFGQVSAGIGFRWDP